MRKNAATQMLAALRRMPLSLLLSLAGGVVWLLAILIHDGVSDPFAAHESWDRAGIGVNVASDVLAMVGCLELGRRHAGSASVGAKIAAVGCGLAMVHSAVSPVLTVFLQRCYPDIDTFVQFAHAQQTVTSLLFAVTAVGLGLATGRVAMAVAGGVISLVLWPPWVFGEWLYEHVYRHLPIDSPRASTLFMEGLLLARQLVTFALGVLASNAPPLAHDPTAPSQGMRELSRALMGRVIVKVALACVFVVMVANSGPEPHPPHDAVGFLRLVGTVANLAMLLLIARGALVVGKGSRDDVPRWPLMLAAALALFAAGALLEQLAGLLTPWLDSFEPQMDHPLLVTVRVARPPPLIDLGSMTELAASAALVCVLATIAVVARRNHLIELAAQATNRTAAFIATVLVGIAALYLANVPNGVLDVGTAAVLFLLVIAFAVVVLTHRASTTCREASHALERGPGLPTAKLVR
jgi:hypothetical protein